MALANAHMMMSSPMPYGKSSLNNSPLVADGSDFPCKQRTGVYDAEGASNVAAIGEPQTLSFIGGATHSGGSCQVSLTTDLQPSKNTKWMVIKSIEGGCPSAVVGNESGDPKGTGASTFQYTVPEGIAPGDYTVAWTWFNKVGNREMYMNCGPMTVTAAKKKRYAPAPKVSKRQSSFPDMFKANIGNGCQTPDSMDVIFPDPGADVQSAGLGQYATVSCAADPSGSSSPQQPTGSVPAGSGSAAATASATANGSGSAPAASSAPAFAGGNSGQYSQAAGGASSVPTSAPAASSPANGSNQVVPVTTSGTMTPVSPSQTMTAPLYTNTSATQAPSAGPTGGVPAAAAPTGSPSSGSTSGTSGALSGPCTNEGDWNCIGGTSFQRCASGAWSAAIPMNGMKCTPGESSSFAMNAAKRFVA